MDKQATAKTIGQYQLGDCIGKHSSIETLLTTGKGAFGAVYRALNTSTGEVVAMKQIKLANIPKSEVNALMSEIDLLKKLNNANIVKYYGFIKTMDYLYIILDLMMRFCENGSLQSVLKKFGKMSENLVSVYIYQVLVGLIYLHDEGVIHRDIKGANVLTTKEGFVKLGDFGVATKQAETDDSSVVGSPYWMAPEVVEMAVPTTASDIWSVGCTIIELIQGVPPYFNYPPMAALFKIVQDDHPPFPEDASSVLKDFLMQCFQKDANLRTTARKLLKHPWLNSARNKFGQTNTLTSVSATSPFSAIFPPSSGNSKPFDVGAFVENEKDFDDESEDFEDNLDDKLQRLPNSMIKKEVFQSFNSIMDESDHEDPFSALEENEDVMFSEPKDQNSKASAEILEIVENLKLERDFEQLKSSIRTLAKILHENKSLSSDLIKYRGVIPTLTLLENITDEETLYDILRMMNTAFEGSSELIENFCLLGAVPRILHLCESNNINVCAESCKIMKRLYSNSELTRRIFVSCRGINVLIALLTKKHEKEIIWTSIEGIYTILTLQGSSPRNDFCRLLTRKNGLVKIVDAMHSLVFERSSKGDELLEKTIEIIKIFSRSDSFVKEAMANHTILKKLIYEYHHLSHVNQILLLKSLKEMSVNQSVLDVMQETGAGEFFVKLLEVKEGSHAKEVGNQIVYILFNFCRVNKVRQEIVVNAGVIPHLQHLIETKHPLKQLALPIICDFVHCSRLIREKLWEYSLLKTYLNLLSDGNVYWQTSALEAIVFWMKEDQENIEKEILEPRNIERIMQIFLVAKSTALQTVVIPVQKLMQSSISITKSLSKASFIQKILERLKTDNVMLKLNLLKMLMSIVSTHGRPKLLSSTYDIDVHIQEMLNSGNCPVLSREIAANILNILQ